MRRRREYRIAEHLKKSKDVKVSHLWLCQVIAYELGLKGMEGYRFSKLCGYDFNITL